MVGNLLGIPSILRIIVAMLPPFGAFQPAAMKIFRKLFPFVCLFLALSAALAADFQPDPATVQRFGAGFRYPQAGWTVVHIEGAPYERGVQHGRLLAPEIAGYIRALATDCKPEAAGDNWRQKRSLVNVMFTRLFPVEQLQEMQGIADGAAVAGAKFDGHPIDLNDIVTINMETELESIDIAAAANSIGLETLRPPTVARAQNPHAPVQGQHCGAFAANGKATRDGKIVFGHITTDDLRPACYFNVWLDLKPASGHHFVMQTMPGGIFSSMDYSISDTGILMGETNISQTSFDSTGVPLASRVRQVTQYAESLDQAVSIMTQDGNGLGSAEWVLADLKQNEIALLVLGNHQQKLFRSSKNEWINGAEGFYWSCNNAKDPAVRLESVASMKSFPTSVAAGISTKRDSIWLKLYEENKGHIDADFGRLVTTTPELTTSYSVDALYTTSDLGLKMQSWGCFGPSAGNMRLPTFVERQRFPGIRPLVVNPWTILQANPPAVSLRPAAAPAVDLHDPVDGGYHGRLPEDAEPAHPQLWHGTLLPASDSDIWLSNGFACYHGQAVREKYLSAKAKESGIDQRGMDDLATELFFYRSVYEQGARIGEEVPLSKLKVDYHGESWDELSQGKGVLLLNSLRGMVGPEKFDELMEEFGQANGGKAVSSRQFQEFFERGTGRSWSAFFDAWLNRTGLPLLELGKIETRCDGNRWHTQVTVRRNEVGAPLTASVTVETANGEKSGIARLETTQDHVELVTDAAPRRVVVDKYRTSSCGNGVPFTALTFDSDLENTWIVYGTLDEVDANRDAATMLQQVLRRREHNVIVAVKADTEVSDEELKNHHLVLLGTPSTNALAARFRNDIPISFGDHSFSFRGTTYANPETSVLVAAQHPLNPRYSMVLYAGLGARATVTLVTKLQEESICYAPVVVLAAGQAPENLVLVPNELIREIPPANDKH